MDQNVEILPPGALVLPSTRLEDLQPLPLLREPQTFDAWFAQLKAEVEAEAATLDHTTETGQEKIRSLSYRVARLKTTIDEEGKSVTEEWRKATKQVNDQRGAIRTKLEKLQDAVKAPMEAWIEEERVRAERVAETMTRLEQAATFPIGTPAADMQARLDKLRAYSIEEIVFRGDYHRALALRAEAIPKIEALILAEQAAEAERAELAVLRAERAAREAAAAAAELARQKTEREAREAEAKAARDAAAAEAATRAAELAHQKAVQDGLNEAAAAEAAEAARLQTEAEQRAAAELAHRQEAERAAAARQRRQERQAEIQAGLIQAGGITAAQADAIVMALLIGEIPHVTVEL